MSTWKRVLFAAFVAAWAPAAGAAPCAYVTGVTGVSSAVSVIDTASNTVVATVPVPAGAYRVAVNPAGTRAYVTSVGDAVSVIDTAANRVVGVVSTASVPTTDLVVSPDGRRVYITNGIKPGLVSVIDAESDRLLAPISVLDKPMGIAVAPDGTYLYVATNARDEMHQCITFPDFCMSLELIEIATGTRSFTFLGENLTSVLAGPDGRHIYVTNIGIVEGRGPRSVVSVLDRGALVDTVEVETFGGLAMNQAATHLYVVGGAGITVIDTASNQIIAGVAIPARRLAVNPAGTRLYATRDNDSVAVVDTATNQVIDTIAIGRDAEDIAIGPEVIGTSPSPTPSATPTATSTETSVPTATATPRRGGGGCAIDSGHGRDHIAVFTLMGWVAFVALRSRARHS